MSTVKHRRRLDAPVRQAAKAVRQAGACHQCRFRKRTCSTGTPCTTCLKTGNGLHELKCQRESPFVGRNLHEYFKYSSTRRTVDFDALISSTITSKSKLEIVSIDGIGTVSFPIRLKATRRLISSFTPSELELISRTQDKRSKESPTSILLLEHSPDLGVEVEQWALNYASKFVHVASTDFYATTMPFILGTAYIKRNLPESALVAAMLRAASLSFVLRAGIRYTAPSTSHHSPDSDPNADSSSKPEFDSTPSSSYRTIQASIDTLLYQRLQLAEASLQSHLQRLVFTSSGRLSRAQIYPVALVLYQLLRISCIASSHLANITRRFRRDHVHDPADAQYVHLKLLLSAHLALFRSTSPLLTDFEDEKNWDLLGGDEVLVGLAKKMREVVLGVKGKGFVGMKGSLAYRREYFEMFRRVYSDL